MIQIYMWVFIKIKEDRIDITRESNSLYSTYIGSKVKGQYMYVVTLVHVYFSGQVSVCVTDSYQCRSILFFVTFNSHCD